LADRGVINPFYIKYMDYGEIKFLYDRTVKQMNDENKARNGG